MSRRIAVYGPAYLDRVIRVEQPLHDPESELPLDQSVDGQIRFADGPGVLLKDPSGFEIEITPPDGWPGPFGLISLDRTLRPGTLGRKQIRGIGWNDDLGGMGAGFASVLGGTLVCALGPESDPTSQTLWRFLETARIVCRPMRIADHPADWTLLITSGHHGDKLPIGFRGCHAAINPAQLSAQDAPQLDALIVAALPNHLSERILEGTDSPLRVFAPTTRNMVDTACSVARFARLIDVLSCNRREWETLETREEVAWRVSILVVTDGPNGSTVRFTTPVGDPGIMRIPAFPRSRPPRDTNRAGEAYASTLVATLLDNRWLARQGVIDESLIRLAALRGSAAAGLVLDRTEFGFPSAREIDAAVEAGRID